MNKKAILKLAGNILAAICLIYIVWTTLHMDVDWQSIVQPPSKILVLAALCGCSAVQYTIGAYAYKILLCFTCNREISFQDVFCIYSKSNLAKYLPGNIMHYAGRNLLGGMLGLEHIDIALATAGELVISLVAAFIISIVMSAPHLPQLILIIRENRSYSLVFCGMVLLGAVVVCVLWYALHRKKSIRGKFVQWASKDGILTSLKVLGFEVLSLFVFGGINFIIYMQILGVNIRISYTMIFTIFGLMVMSWMIGFIVPGAPGGIGIRETAMVVLLAPVLGKDQVALGAVLLRAANIAGDLIMFACSLAWMRSYSNKT